MRLAIVLAVLVTLVRLINLLETPVFGDEGLYCYLGYQINQLPAKQSIDLVLNFWKDAPLLPLLNAAALKLSPFVPPLWICRAAVTITAGLGSIILFSLGGWWAGLFYLLNPFNFFLDRTILMEPVLNTVMLAFIAVALAAMKRGTKLLLILSAFSTGLLLAAKQTGMLVLPIPLVWALLKRRQFPYLKQVSAVIVITAMGMIGLALTTTKLWDTAAMHTTTVLSLPRLKTNLWLIGNWLIQYWTWWVTPMIILGWRWKWILTVAYFILTFALFGWTLFPRYLLIVVPFVALLAGQAAKNPVGKTLLIILLVIFVNRDITILFEPERARLARETRYQFFEDWGSGRGTKFALEWLDVQQLAPQTILLVPQDIQGLWIISQLSFTPEINLVTNFYTNDYNLIAQIEANRDKIIFLVATTQQNQWIKLAKDRYELTRLLATHGDNRYSITIDRIN